MGAAELAPYLDRWDLTLDGAPFETQSSWLAFVRHTDRRAALKVYKPGSDEARGARYLGLHRGCGTVPVLASDDNAILLERVTPGTRLTELSLSGRDDEATHIVCDVIEKLQSVRARATGWPGHEEHRAQFNRCVPVPPVTPAIAARAEALFAELEATEPERVLLHGDLHHENILFDERCGWTAIDPKGEAGDLAYELAAPLRNPYQHAEAFLTPEVMERRVAIYCERLMLDRRRVLSWAFARNCSAALWYADGTPVPERTKIWPLPTLSALALLDR